MITATLGKVTITLDNVNDATDQYSMAHNEYGPNDRFTKDLRDAIKLAFPDVDDEDLS